MIIYVESRARDSDDSELENGCGFKLTSRAQSPMIWWSQNSRRSECIYIRRRGVQCVGWILHRICSAQHIMIRQRAKDICARDMRWMFKMYIVSVWECVPGGKVEQGCSVWGRRLFSAALTHHTCILLIGGETTTTTTDCAIWLPFTTRAAKPQSADAF